MIGWSLPFAKEERVILKAMSRKELRPVAETVALQLAVVRNGVGGLGTVVHSLDSPELIEGVRVARGTLWPDDRGNFQEIFRSQQGLAEGFASQGILQVSAALSFPGTVKAIHYHLNQTDLWTPVIGMLQVMLYDLRTDSPTFGCLNTLYAGIMRPLQIRIPPGVGHGYKVLGTEAALLIYATDRFYDPSDEGRLPWNDSDINYDWETQRK